MPYKSQTSGWGLYMTQTPGHRLNLCAWAPAAPGRRLEKAPFPPSPSRLRWGAITQYFFGFFVARPVWVLHNASGGLCHA